MVNKPTQDNNATEKRSIPTETAGVFPNVVIRASAGTGKTFRLSNRYLKLLASGIDCQEILATTFTKKGAGEILDRIIQRLARAALSTSHAGQLEQELEIPFPQSRAKTVLQSLLRGMHRMEISTLDSFFNGVARVFSLELGLPPTWDIVEEQQIDALRRRTIHEILRNEDVVNMLPLLVKGESSRKIASLVMDVVERMYDIRRESQPEAWDCLEEPKTFLPPEQLDDITDRVMSLTFAKGKQIPKHWQEKIQPNFATENWSALAETASIQNILKGTFKLGSAKLPPEALTLLQAIIPHLRAHITHRLIQQNRATCELLGLFGEKLESLKGDLGQLRFDDVTERLVAFVSMWNTDQFSFRLDHQIKHLLLDEFQDTSPTQWDVIRPFAENVCTSNDPLRSFFCVGDMKQAIYGWRGGVAEIFDLVEDHLSGLDKAEPLTMSYRSSQTVIDLVNDVFLKLNEFKSKNEVINRGVHGWSSWFSTHSTARPELKGHVTIEYAAECDLDTVRTNEPQKFRLRNENVITATVQRVGDLNEKLPPEKTIGVLVRTNREVGTLIFKLQQAGIRASEEGGNPLTDSAAVELVLSALKLADHPGDSIARFHVSHSPLAELFHLQPETMETQKLNIEMAATGAAELRERLVQDGYGPTIESLARILAPKCTKRELIRLQHLVRLAYANRSDAQRWSMRPTRFVDYIRNEVKIADASSARVRVMTIHRSKGLEFDAVVMPHPSSKNGWLGQTKPLIVGRPSPTEDIEIVCRYANQFHRKLLPNEIQEVFEADQERSVREAMCVLYVAMTRAVHSLHVILSMSDKHNQNSAAGVLLSTVCPDAVRKEGIIFEAGDKDWSVEESVSEQSAIEKNTDAEGETNLANSNSSDIDSEKIDQYYLQHLTSALYRPLNRKPKSKRGIARIRPSQLEGGNKVRLCDTLTSPDRERSLEFGSLLHACFEQVRWLDVGETTEDEDLKVRLAMVAPGSEQIDGAVARFRELLAEENLQKLLSAKQMREQFVIPDLDFESANSESPNRLEVHTEKRLAVLLGKLEGTAPSSAGTIVEGVVDRLVLVYENDRVVAAEIVDFKVDHIDGSNLTERIQFYRPQIAAYQTAVQSMFDLASHKVSSRLVFVHSGQVIQMNFQDHSISGDTDLKLPKKSKAAARSTEKSETESEAKSEAESAVETKVKSEPKLKRKRKAKTDSEPSGDAKVVKKVKKPKHLNEDSAVQKMLWSDDAEDTIR